jgi:hypothetical protein
MLLEKSRKDKGWCRGGGAVCCRFGRGGVGRWPVHILTINDGFTDGMFLSVNPSIILSVKVTCHYMAYPVWIQL